MFALPSAPASLPSLPLSNDAGESPSSRRLLKRAERHITRKHYAEAITSLREAMDTGADACLCALHIADLESRRQRWGEALRAAEQAVTFGPERAIAWEMLMTVSLQAGNAGRALAASQALIKRQPRHQAARETLVTIYLQRGQVDAALRVLHILIRLNPADPANHFHKGLLCQHKGEIALAAQAFTACLELDSEGQYASGARDALETLDACQLNQILTLGMEDGIFRAQLLRDAGLAASERGFTLSEHGCHILRELCAQLLPYALETSRATRCN